MYAFANSKSEWTADRNPEKNITVLLGVLLNINFDFLLTLILFMIYSI